jgi:4a-hydroxytetrahydrobiopterin dehydratase
MHLLQMTCTACEGGTPPLTPDEITAFKADLTTAWEVVDQKHLCRSFTFADFKEAMRFVNKVADIAESEGHHPDIAIHWNKVDIDLSTHAIGGLSENDFILAAKIELL